VSGGQVLEAAHSRVPDQAKRPSDTPNVNWFIGVRRPSLDAFLWP
jgi:hypothetical protein